MRICRSTRLQTSGKLLYCRCTAFMVSLFVFCNNELHTGESGVWLMTIGTLVPAVCMTSVATSVHLILDLLRRTWSCISAVSSNPFMMTILAWMVLKTYNILFLNKMLLPFCLSLCAKRWTLSQVEFLPRSLDLLMPGGSLVSTEGKRLWLVSLQVLHYFISSSALLYLHWFISILMLLLFSFL